VLVILALFISFHNSQTNTLASFQRAKAFISAMQGGS
jgi:hypothetical protein